MARDPAVESATDQSLLRQELLPKGLWLHAEIVSQHKRRRQPGESGKFRRHLLPTVGWKRCSGEQRGGVFAAGEFPRLGDRLGQVLLEVGWQSLVGMRHSREARQERAEGEVVAGGGANRLEVDQPRHEHESAEKHPVLVLQCAGEPRRAKHAVAFATEILGRPPALVPGGVESDEFGDRIDVGALAEELLRLLILGGPAVSGGHRIDEHEVGGEQRGRFVVDELERRGRERAVVVHLGTPRSQAAQMQPDGRCPRPAVEAEEQRPLGSVERVSRLGGRIRPGGRVERIGDVEDRRLGCAIFFQQR